MIYAGSFFFFWGGVFKIWLWMLRAFAAGCSSASYPGASLLSAQPRQPHAAASSIVYFAIL